MCQSSGAVFLLIVTKNEHISERLANVLRGLLNKKHLRIKNILRTRDSFYYVFDF